MKKISKMKNNCTSMWKSGHFDRKAQAALALAVSLWIANGGVASAENKTVWTGTTIDGDESANDYKLGGQVNAPKGKGITFTVEEGGKVQSISGNNTPSPKSSGNTVIVKEGGSVGIASDAIIGGLSNNEVSIEGTVTGKVYGGKNQSGNSTNNHVVVTGTVKGGVYGGYGKTATNNTVVILGGHVTGTVYGGGGDFGDTTTNNTVILKGATVDEGVYGGGSEGDATGNTLIVSGTNTVGENVARLQTIKLAEDLEWDGTNAVLTAGDYLRITGQSSIALDISEASALTNRTASGTSTMTLIKATDDNCEFEYKKFSLSTTGDEITTDGVTVKSGATTAGTGGVTIGYNSTHTVAKDNTNKAITYTVANSPVNNIALGSIAWNAGGTVFDGTGYDFSTAFSSTNIMNGTVSLDTTNFKLTVANEAAYKSMAPGASMTLINNATGLTGASGSYGSGFDYTVANGTKLDTWVNTQYYIGKNYAEDTAHADKMTLDIGSVYIQNVDLTNWDSTKDAFAVTDGWRPRDGQTYTSGPVPVTAAGFTAPTIDAGTSKEIITTNTTNFFSNDKITGALKYGQSVSTDNDKGVWFTGFESKGVKASDDGKKLIYARSNFNVRNIRLGEMTWGTPREATTSYDFANVETIKAENLEFTNPDAVTGSGTLLTGAVNLATGASIAHTQNFTKEVNGATLYATLSGNVTRETAGQIGYTATGTTLDSISLTGWNGTEGSIPTGWTSALGNSSITAVSVDGSGVAPGTEQNILTTNTENFFNDNQITDALKYKAYASKSETLSGVTLTGSESKGVKASTDGKNLVYARSDKNVSNISFGTMKWGMSLTADTGYNYTNANIDLSKLTFSNPENISAGGTTTLLVANNTLAAIGETVKNVSYEYSPVAGVTVNGTVNGSCMTTNVPALQYTATANKATKLTFGNVAWKDTGALMERPEKITFAGAAVDTSNINFTNISELEANKEMTLVGNFGDTVGTITGTKYMVGSTLQGEGKASLEGSNLIFRTDTTAEKMEVQEQTHNTVMSEEVALEALGAGDDFIAAAEDGLGHASNVGADGIASFATMGGGSIRQETGSHVDTRTWNAIIALGHKNEKEKCSFEYGAFFEYGRGNYTTYNGDQRGDGSTYYTGGGLLAKWQKKDGIYVEGSLRAGNVHDDAKNVLRDAMGNPYSYETDAPYWGVHVGVGKVIQLNESSELDVYGKFFHNHRNSVSFDAGGHYDLDAVNSDVLRLGTRYVMKREKWNFYGGLAYEQEFSGKAEGTADGMAIRGADTSGGSLRAELGAVLNPKKDGPITLDFNLSGFAGKKRGLTGGVAVTFNF